MADAVIILIIPYCAAHCTFSHS